MVAAGAADRAPEALARLLEEAANGG